MRENIFEPGLGQINFPSEEERLEAQFEQDRQRIVLVAVMDLIKAQQKAHFSLSKNDSNTFEEPKPTGTYIAVGVYSGNGPHWSYSAAVTNEQRITRQEIADKLAEKFPKGFATIPYDSRELPGTSHGSIMAYWCYDVPQNLIHLIDWEAEKI